MFAKLEEINDREREKVHAERLAKIRATMNEGCWLLQKGLTRCEVICSELGDRAGVLGAIRKVQVSGKRD